MKNKSSLTLLELLIMIMVFALAAALCLRAFVFSGKISRQDEAVSLAERRAQAAAEVLKASRGDVEKAAEILGGETAGDFQLTVQYDPEGNVMSPPYYPTGYKEPPAVESTLTAYVKSEGLLGQAEIVVTDSSGSTVCTLTCSWQEDAQ